MIFIYQVIFQILMSQKSGRKTNFDRFFMIDEQ